MESILSTILARVAPLIATPDPRRRGWVQPRFIEDPILLGHIFKRSKGHLPLDTPENRALILYSVADPANWVMKTRFGVDIYLKILPNGTQAWAHVNKDGIITSGGCNLIPVHWIADARAATGARAIPLIQYRLARPSETDFKITVQFHRLQTCHTQQGYVKTRAAIEKVKGVGQQVGVILNLFERIEALYETEHILFLPTPEGLFLSQEEIQMLTTEVARGIFLHNQVPWFSLFANRDSTRAPIIHPVYQGTFTGHVIALLDYYMKFFFEGFFYDPAFICDWGEAPNLDEKFLEAHLQDFRRYCHSQGLPYSSSEELLLKVRGERAPGCPLKDSKVSFRITAKQNSIRHVENLFVIDGGFDVKYDISPTPETREECLAYSIREEACRQMAAQISDVMPKLPLFKKYFQALSIINFLTYYYITLQAAHKIPIIQEKGPCPVRAICPPLFPPIPTTMSRSRVIVLDAIDFLGTINSSHKDEIFRMIRDPSIPLSSDTPIVPILAEILRANSGEWASSDFSCFIQMALMFFSKYRYSYQDVNKRVEEGLVELKYKRREEPVSAKVKAAFKEKMRQYIELIQSDIKETERKIARAQRLKQSIRVLEAELLGHKKSLEGFSLQNKVFCLWFDNPVTACIHSKLLVLYPLLNAISFRNSKPQGQPFLVGGCGLEIVDQVAELDARYAPLLDTYLEPLKVLPHNVLLPVEGGVIFKMAFADQPLVDAEEKAAAVPLFSYRENKPLREKEIVVLRAIDTSDVETVETTVLDSWNIRDAQGVPIMHYAARQSNLFFLQFLARKRLALDARDSEHFTPLHVAAAAGNLRAVEFLFAQRPDLIDATSVNGETALYLAAQHGHLPCVQFLLAQKASTDVLTTHGMMAIHVAIYQNFEDVALEIAKIPEKNLEIALYDGTRPAHMAVEKRMERLLAYFAKNADFSVYRLDGYNPLHIASQNGWLKGVQIIVTSCAYLDLNAKNEFGCTALELAVIYGHPDVQAFLLSKGCTPTTLTFIPDEGSAAAARGEEEVSLLEADYPLHTAVGRGSLDDVYRCLKKGINPLCRDDSGLTPLDLAIDGGFIFIADALTVEVDFPKDARPYIQNAVIKDDFMMLAWLVKWGAPIDMPDEAGWVAVHVAAQKGDIRALSFLLCMGANAAVKAPDGRSIQDVASPVCAAFIERYTAVVASSDSRTEVAIQLGDQNALTLLCRQERPSLPKDLAIPTSLRRLTV